MVRTKDQGAQRVINFTNSMFREARKTGFNGRQLRQICSIFKSMAEAVPEGEIAKLEEFDDEQPRETL